MRKLLKLTWVVLALAGAFTMGYYFKPGTEGSRRMPPQLNMQQLMQRMPQRYR